MCSVFPLISDSGAPAISSCKELDSPTLYIYYMSKNDQPGFNSMISCVVCAASQREALKINPYPNDPKIWDDGSEISITLVGKAFAVKNGEVICASWNHSRLI